MLQPVKYIIASHRDQKKDNKPSYPPAGANLKALPNYDRKSSYCSILQTLLGKTTVQSYQQNVGGKNCKLPAAFLGPVVKPRLFELIRNCAPVPCI
jgi:hypothetical protein